MRYECWDSSSSIGTNRAWCRIIYQLKIYTVWSKDSGVKEKKKLKKIEVHLQGPRSNFEMGRGGGGAPLVTRYGGGGRHLFLLTLYNSKNIVNWSKMIQTEVQCYSFSSKDTLKITSFDKIC